MWTPFSRKTDPERQYAAQHASLKKIIDYRTIINDETDEETRERFIDLTKTAAGDQPEHGLSHAAMAWVHYLQKEPILAIDQANKAIEKGPANFRPDWLVERGMYQANNGDVAAGLTDMTEACRLKTWNHDAHYRRAQLLMSMHDNISVAVEGHFGNQNIHYDETQNSIFAFFYNTGCYSRPEDLEVTFMVLTEPLNPAIRQFRAEMLMDFTAPRPAMLDYQFVSWQSHKNLYANARIEDIRENGILANPPIVVPDRPSIQLLPEYAAILKKYKRYHWRKTAWKSGFGLSKIWTWVFIRLGLGPIDESRRYAFVNLLLALAFLCFCGTFSTLLMDARTLTYLVKIPQGYTNSVNVREIRMLSDFLSGLLIFCQFPLGILACKSFLALFKKPGSNKPEDSSLKFLILLVLSPFLFLLMVMIGSIPYHLMMLVIRWLNHG